jgi:signal transduction histidine kinase
MLESAQAAHPLQRRLGWAFAAVLAVVITLALAVFDTARRALESGERVARSREVLQALGGVEISLLRAESATRAFVITGDAAFVADRDAALAALRARTGTLRRLTADNASQQARWEALRARLDGRAEVLERLAAARRSGGAGAARAFLQSVFPRGATGAIPALLAEMGEEEGRRLERNARSETRAYTAAAGAGLLLTAAFVLVFSLGYAAVRRQVAETVKLNADLARRTGEAEAANAELESFSYSVSHDLRAPLRALDGFSRILADDHGRGLDGEGTRLVEVIRGNARKMGQLVDGLLDFARLGKKPLAVSALDMTALARDAWEELRAAHPEGEAALDLAPLPAATGDATLVRQVFANLLSNALKYARKDRPARIEVRGRAEGGERVYCVADNGVGFDMKYYDKLFGVFQRLHAASEYPGTGVGLAIVQRVVLRHGGRVWAEGKVGEGAAFWFSLPARAPLRREIPDIQNGRGAA